MRRLDPDPTTRNPAVRLSRDQAMRVGRPRAVDVALVVSRRSRRDQIEPETVEFLRKKFAGIPIVNLLGSWCEGETRSGNPLPGVIRVYWHQWNGQYGKFVSQLKANQITDWHQPPTATIGDRVLASKTISE